ncbi:MAG: hypothetical protein V1754_10435, partial [Pseudomonadota bacterium]
SLFLLFFSWTSPASAKIPTILQPTKHAFFASFGMGPAIGLHNISSQFKLTQEFGWHFWGDGSGPAIGGSLQEAFVGGFATLEIGPKFWWDIQPVKELGLYIAPCAQMGLAYAGIGNGYAGFNLQFGVEARLALGGIGMVLFRPITFDLGIGDAVVVRWDMMFGGGVYFL